MGPRLRTLRRCLLGAILAGCLAVGVLPALAADQGVEVVDFAFSPREVAVMPGQMVTWTNSGSFYDHSVHFDGEPSPIVTQGKTFTVSRTFPTAGEFRYHCDVHPITMRGTVFVNDTGTVPTPTATASPTATPTASPTATAPPGSTTVPGPGSSAVVVSSFSAKAARASFCSKRSRKCKRPGVVLSVKLGATDSVRVTGTLRRRPLKGGSLRRFGSVAFTAQPGSHRIRLSVRRRLTSGRYVLELKLGSLTRRVQFRVRAA